MLAKEVEYIQLEEMELEITDGRFFLDFRLWVFHKNLLSFSFVDFEMIKGWKLHTKMTMNLVVPIGNVGFVFYDQVNKVFMDYTIGEKNYKRLTVPPNTWFGFKGLSSNQNLVVNFADIKHDQNEAKKSEITRFSYNWGAL